MGGGESEKEEDWPAPPSVARARLVDAPVLSLSLLIRLFGRSSLPSTVWRRRPPRVGRRAVNLSLTLIGDALVKNVVPTYALEHKSIDDKFSSIFRHLDLLMKKDEDAPQMFQELLFSIGTVQTMICQHMHKEEEQDEYLTSLSKILSRTYWLWTKSVDTIQQDTICRISLPKNNLSLSGSICAVFPRYYWRSGRFPGFSMKRDLQRPTIYAQKAIFDKFVYQLLSLLAKNTLSPCSPLIDECHIKGLQSLLFYEREGLAQLRSFIETLCQELESLVRGLVKNLMFLETEVFPSISESCTSEMQLWLLYTSLHMMPLGLLRCTVTWFSAHLSCSGKISIDKFRQNLEEMFNGRSFYLAEQNRQNNVSSGQLLKPNSAMMMKKSVAIPSSSISITTEEHDISYTFGMNHHKFFSQMFKRMPPLQKNLTESDRATFLTLESRPMDLVFYIHRALIKDMEYLVSLSAMLATNFGYLAEFKNRFKFLNKIYQIHSDSEDEIAFPALEAKGALQNISHSYCIDHKLETKHFSKTSIILNQISELHDHEGSNETRLKQYQLCLKLHDTCLSMHKVLSDHIHREEVEIFPLFRGCFSTEEEEKIIGHMLGVTRAEILQEKIPWLMAYLTSEEQNAVMSLWLKVARYTKFDEWLREWWEGMTRYNISATEEESRPSPSLAADPLEVVSMYLLKDGTQTQKVGHDRGIQKELTFVDFKHSGSCNVDESTFAGGGQDACQSEVEPSGTPLSMDQEDLEATIRRVSRDSNLDSQKKSYIIQNLLMSRWIITQKMSQEEASVANHKGEIPGQTPSYRDPLKLTFGCEHYKRNCKLLAPCCNKLYTCIRCHDDLTDHTVDRKAITKMMCMKCLCAMQLANDNQKGKYTIALTATCAELERGWALITSTDYTFSHYICPVCSKSLGDMQVYFGMLDALLAEEKIPEEYAGQTQVILCNDCEKRGTASFHWLYHKCPHCGSYNTRLL
ncbi:hypothetical protein DH2020_019408 [Rehmannia glutinosa]|uniref:CHY-type domain-containing protein n=1 Tax=Rehmannia glutinosa TaxID=99300 RepID=A0ABR0WNI7_REHGL